MSPPDKDKDALRDTLRSKLRGDEGETPVDEPEAAGGEARPAPARPAQPQSDSGGGLKREVYFRGPGLAQMSAFCRQIATLVEVGIPLVQSLNTLAQRVEHPKLKRVVADVARRVEEGQSFSDALAAHPSVFSTLIVNVVRVGESGGILEGSLRYLADIMERRYEIRRRVQGAVAYPVAVLVVCGLALLVILGFAMPVFEKTYEGIGELPALTAFVLGISGFVQTFWWLIILVVVGVVLGVRWAVRNHSGLGRFWDWLVLHLPIGGKIARKVNVTRSAKTLSNLLGAGIPLLEALQITAETAENQLVEEMLRRTHDHLEGGGRIDQPLREADIFPPLVVDMIAIGDEAGRLQTMFDKVAETYDSDVEQSIRTLNAVLEPTMIVVMGTIVLVLALAVLLPYWKIGGLVAE